MSKVMCDVCGTAYPETASQCPICGSARNSTQQTAAGSPEAGENSSSYAYVKGGRFSKKNVRRRNKRGTTAQRRSGGSSRNVREENEPNNTGLIIVVILLLIAIASVLAFIITKFYKPGGDPADSQGPSQSQSQPSGTSDPSDPVRIPCVSVTLSNPQLELAVGETWTLTTVLEPLDTTDTVAFISADPSIAAVDDTTGEITMIAEGETAIVAVCGNVTAECIVRTPESTGPSDPTDPVVPGEFELDFNTPFTDSTTGLKEVSLTSQGETWKSYKTSLDVDPALITWTSDNPEMAKIENGVVTAVAPGTTKIHATYNGVTHTCIIRCNFKLSDDPAADCIINKTDVSIKIGESFTLTLRDPSGYKLEVTWQCDTDGVTINGNKITGASAGNHKVYVVYDGKTYSCIVRVKG